MNSKKIGVVSLSFSFAGCFLGAGYVSGKELWQYFGVYGKSGIAGLILSILMLGTVCSLLILLSRRAGTENMAEILIRKNAPALRAAVGVLMIILVFGIVCIMTAGIGAMFQQYFSVPAKTGCLAAIVIISAIAYFGVSGMVKMFTVSVPVLIVAAVFISLAAVTWTGRSAISFAGDASNPLLGNWLIASMNYASLNFVASIAILIPLAPFIDKRKTVAGGISVGCLFLLSIALCILYALAAVPASVERDLPMLYVAGNLGKLPGFVYTLLLFLGMMGTSVSSFVAVCVYAEQKSERVKQHRLVFIIILSVFAYAVSCAGFGNLIASVYPLYGYLGFIFIILILEHIIHLRKTRTE